jgi:DNA polymerase-3 subunit alpha
MAAYSVVAYQTGYLKANYPAEYMAAVLTHNMDKTDKITVFMEDCRKLGIEVLGPDINESNLFFDVNDEGQIRFGLGAIKGSGESAVTAIIEERNKNGKYQNIFEFAKRSNLRAVNKKTFECLAMAGAFDCFSGLHRRQYLYADNGDNNLIELAVRYGANAQQEAMTNQQSLFGGENGVAMPVPKAAPCEPFSELEKLKLEKEVLGFYISGHPLDQFKLEINNFCTCTLDKIADFKNSDIAVAGIINRSVVKQGRNGQPFGLFSIEDYQTSVDLAMFGEEFLSFKHLINIGEFIYIKGRVEERYNQPGVWELRPKTIQLLSEIREKLTKGLHLYLYGDNISGPLVDHLEELFANHPGNCTLRLSVLDETENIGVDLHSMKYRISPDNDLMRALEKIKEVSIKVF